MMGPLSKSAVHYELSGNVNDDDDDGMDTYKNLLVVAEHIGLI